MSNMTKRILYARASGVYHGRVTRRIITSEAGPEAEGLRLDEYLSKRFTYCTLAQWRLYVQAGRVMVEGTQGSGEQRLTRGQLIEFKPPEDAEPEVDSSYTVVYEDNHLLVVYKPPLLPIHPGGRFFAHTLWYLLARDRGKLHIATRLDRETSGLVLAAKNPGTAHFLQEQHKEGNILKTYQVLVHGRFPPETLQAKGWLVPAQESLVRKKRRFLQDLASVAPALPMESSHTQLTGQASWQAEDGIRSLVEARLITGRTHQIRASLYSLGFPILGDKLYGLDEAFFLRFIAGSLSAEDSATLVLPYQALHCGNLEFSTVEGTRIILSTPAPWMGLVPGT